LATPAITHSSFGHLWLPVGRGSGLIEGLEELADRFESETGEELELIINQDYTERIENLSKQKRRETRVTTALLRFASSKSLRT